MMEGRKLAITLVSAENLPNVRSLGQMKVYTAVSLNGKPETTKYSDVDLVGETNPTWNFRVDYTIVESSIEELGESLVVKLMCRRTLGDKFIGEVRIPINSLFERGIKCENVVSFIVEGSVNGRLNILYSFGEKIVVTKDSTSAKLAAVDLFLEGAGAIFSIN